MFILESESHTEKLAWVLAEETVPGDVIGLTGNLGAGKSFFARAFIQIRCKVIEVPSPTFTLVQTYDDCFNNNNALCEIWHLDLYRLKDSSEALELGIEDAIGKEILLIEWARNIDNQILGDWLEIDLRFSESHSERTLILNAHGPRSETLKKKLSNYLNS